MYILNIKQQVPHRSVALIIQIIIIVDKKYILQLHKSKFVYNLGGLCTAYCSVWRQDLLTSELTNVPDRTEIRDRFREHWRTGDLKTKNKIVRMQPAIHQNLVDKLYKQYLNYFVFSDRRAWDCVVHMESDAYKEGSTFWRLL